MDPHRTQDIDPQPTSSRRPPWRRPRILFREPLETLATVCAPAPPAKGDRTSCPSGPIAS